MNIWPWSRIRKLEKELESERAMTTWLMDELNRLDPSIVYARIPKLNIPNPRSSFKITGIEIPHE